MSLIQRRSFLVGIGAALAAPAIVRVQSLMPVKKIILPDNWHHYVVLRNSKGIRTYIDGVMQPDFSTFRTPIAFSGAEGDFEARWWQKRGVEGLNYVTDISLRVDGHEDFDLVKPYGVEA